MAPETMKKKTAPPLNPEQLKLFSTFKELARKYFFDDKEKQKKLGSRLVVDKKKGTYEFNSRAAMLSKLPLPSGGRIEFDFEWKLGGAKDNTRQDYFTIALRTDGKRYNRAAYEVQDAYVVGILPHARQGAPEGVGTLTIEKRTAAPKGKSAGETIDKALGVEMKRNTKYHVIIIDTGKRISVEFQNMKGENLGSVNVEAPEEKLNPFFFGIDRAINSLTRRYVMMYNREPLGGEQKQTVISNLKITPFSPKLKKKMAPKKK